MKCRHTPRVHVCACAGVCAYVHVCPRVRACVHVWMGVCVCVCACACVQIFRSLSVRRCVSWEMVSWCGTSVRDLLLFKEPNGV